MLTRLVKFVIAKGIGAPGRSWIYASTFMTLARFAKNRTGRREVIDISSTKPGDKIVIEHLGVTHKQQIKQFKAEKKADKSHAKAEKKAAKQLEKELRQARKG